MEFPAQHEPLPWQTLESTELLRTPWWALWQDTVRTHQQATLTYYYLERSPFIMVVPLLADGQVAMLHQYRYSMRRWCWEFPAGRIDQGETPLQAAQRELQEEIGGTSSEWQAIGTYTTSSGITNERYTLYVARQVHLGANQPEETELFTISRFSRQDALDMLDQGEITDGPTALAMLRCLT
jgi:ADP-ribose pyrophosphatase